MLLTLIAILTGLSWQGRRGAGPGNAGRRLDFGGLRAGDGAAGEGRGGDGPAVGRRLFHRAGVRSR
jgi:hypothetical protein